MPLRPTQIHADEHLRPVRRIGTTDSGADRQHSVALVIRSGELRLEAGLLDFGPERFKVALELRVHRRVVRELCQLGQVSDAPPELVPALDARPNEADALQDLLRVLTVVPEIGTRGLSL